jgi:argininosuccinate lyase
MSGNLSEGLSHRAWHEIAHVLNAHLTMLCDVSILDEPALNVLLDVVESVRESEPPARSLQSMLVEFEQRVDSQSPAEVRGATHVGRASTDVLTTVTRMIIRADLVELAHSTNDLRGSVLELAGSQVVSLIAAYADGQPAQPTTIAHLLGGVIGPLERAARRLTMAYETVDQCPMGAASLASTGFEIDPSRTAELLGFARPMDNSYDAVAAVDHVFEALYVASVPVAATSRFLEELLQMHRSQPDSIQLDDDWTESDPALPQFKSPMGLVVLARDAFDVERIAAILCGAIGKTPYGPVIGPDADALLAASDVITRACSVLDRTADLLANGLQFNRAVMANRAGKGLITSSDLADFLMLEEQLPPAAAQAIANRTIGMARDEGREASGITPELIDSAALLILGRELRVEFETISRYLAPRRFIERRSLTGGPAPATMRAYLEQARNELEHDQRWQSEIAARLTRIEGSLQPAPVGTAE